MTGVDFDSVLPPGSKVGPVQGHRRGPTGVLCSAACVKVFRDVVLSTVH